MSATTGLALYAAVIATLGIVWQIWSWYLGRRTVIRVSVAPAYLFPDNAPEIPVIAVTAVNRSSHEINVHEVSLLAQDGSGRRIIMPRQPPGATIPGVIPPRDSGRTQFTAGELPAAFDIDRPVTAEIKTAVGTFQSKPTTLRKPQ